ncbi:MAG: hypothetical protein LBI27_09920 [Clostridiales bacterium]|nr:hypothetical protein [Clostridiales bacterium]
MEKPGKPAIISLVCVAIGFIGSIAYTIFFYTKLDGLFVPEILFNEELADEVSMSMFSIIWAFPLGLLMLFLLFAGIAFGIYGMIESEKGSKSFKLSKLGTTLNIVALVLSITMVIIASLAVQADMWKYFLNAHPLL